jgi:phosphohistidine phosphatase
MMRILLLRHAKSSWDTPGLNDHDRPLARRGERAASAMGAHFANTDLRMDRIVSSTAARAWSTALRFQEAFDKRIPMMRRRDLYHADEMSLLAIALEEAGTDDGARIMLVGHNPGIHDLALLLCGEGGPAETASLQAKFPTGTLAEFDLSGRPTLEIPPGAGRLLRFTRPKDLPVAKRPERPRRDRPATRPG